MSSENSRLIVEPVPDGSRSGLAAVDCTYGVLRAVSPDGSPP